MSTLIGSLRRVMLVEDDIALAESTARALATDGWDVIRAGSGEAALSALDREQVDLLVLDVGLPGMDGFALCRALRTRDGAPPILMLTARDDVGDRVKGLELGADDYLVKPFAVAELLARANAVLRRQRLRGARELKAGQLRMDLEARRAFCGDTALALTAREWTVLEYLMSRIGKLVSKNELQSIIDAGGDGVSANAVEAHASRTRAKLKGTQLALRSVRGYGYILEVESDAAAT
jgi:two-component system, OmpR family, response regulator